MTSVTPEMTIDLDRDLLRSNVLAETLLAHVKTQPLLVLALALQLPFKPNATQFVASRLAVDPASLLYDMALLTRLAQKAAQGEAAHATSTLPRPWLEAIIAHLPGLDGHAPATAAPVSNSHASPASGFGCQQPTWQELTWQDMASQAFKALRPHQWAKNILVFVPVILAHRAGDPHAIMAALLAFVCFSLAASGMYLLNDMMDLAQDRKHPAKRNRPFASGRLPVSAGFFMLPACLAGAIGLATLLPDGFMVVLGLYGVLNLAYTFYLKSKLLVDVLALAGAYTLRILGGERALDIDMSFWLLAFSTFMFLSLALVKRYVELDTVEDETGNGKNRVMGRGYRKGDLDMLSQLGVASGFSAVLVLALYVDGAGRLGLYKTPEFIWLVCPIVLYVIGRIWVLAKRRELPDDPVLFIIRDWRSHLMGLIVIAVMITAKTVGYTF